MCHDGDHSFLIYSRVMIDENMILHPFNTVAIMSPKLESKCWNGPDKTVDVIEDIHTVWNRVGDSKLLESNKFHWYVHNYTRLHFRVELWFCSDKDICHKMEDRHYDPDMSECSPYLATYMRSAEADFWTWMQLHWTGVFEAVGLHIQRISTGYWTHPLTRYIPTWKVNGTTSSNIRNADNLPIDLKRFDTWRSCCTHMHLDILNSRVQMFRYYYYLT